MTYLTWGRSLSRKKEDVMNDPTHKVEHLSMSLAQALGESWDEMPEERQQRFRACAFNILEQSWEVRRNGIDSGIGALEELVLNPGTPQRWQPGLYHAIQALAILMELEEEIYSVGANVPESLSNELTAEDPYATLKAGDKDPYGAFEGQQCGAEHEFGWECTRPDHPPHWKHWDADKEVAGRLVAGTVHVVWWDSGESDDIEVAPGLEHDEDE